MCKVMASRTLKCPKKPQHSLRWLQKYYFVVLYKAWLIYILVHILSLGNIGLCIMCVATINSGSQQKVTALCQITGVTF